MSQPSHEDIRRVLRCARIECCCTISPSSDAPVKRELFAQIRAFDAERNRHQAIEALQRLGSELDDLVAGGDDVDDQTECVASRRDVRWCLRLLDDALELLEAAP